MFRTRLANFVFSDIEIDKIKVKHLEVTAITTLTTPKVVLTELGADPVNNGELVMNGGTIKGKTGGTVKNW